MNSFLRPVLLGYIRADVLKGTSAIRKVKAELASFAEREQFSLGTIYVEKGAKAGVFDSLMDELTQDESAWGLVIPDLRHLTVVEQLILSGHEEGASTAVLAASFTPRAGGPGVGSPIRARSAFPRHPA